MHWAPSSVVVTVDRNGHLPPDLDEAVAVAFDERGTKGARAAGVA